MKKYTFYLVILSFVFSLPASNASTSVLTGFNHLIEITTDEKIPFASGEITSILDYVMSDQYAVEPSVHVSGMDKATWAYEGFQTEGALQSLVKYYYNTDIPSCAVMPSVIRVSSWKSGNGNPASVPASFWKSPGNEYSPHIFRGLYYVQNTPDPDTGAYYGYDSLRTVILMNYKGRRALVSVMKQKSISEVGRKGYVVGDKKDMDFFYSGEQGLTMKGLGWVKSYIYDSCSVTVTVECEKNGKNTLRCGMFKWIRAGWAGKNIVSKTHVQKGMADYVAGIRHLLSLEMKKAFPSPEELVEICNSYRDIPVEEMKKKVENLIKSIQGKCAVVSFCPRGFQNGVDVTGYVEGLNHDEMSAVLIADHVKAFLGKQSSGSRNIVLKKQSESKIKEF